MDGTRAKSIFDIPRPLSVVRDSNEGSEVIKVVRRKSKKKAKKPKVAKAGGVEVSQIKGSSKSQITLKQKGGLTQEITIYTGDKPNQRVGKGRTNFNKPNWNMKPSKFKNSRGLRDDRVYLQPPKREYFGNRYKSAIDKIKIDQKVKEAGANKNKEIADVRDTANREKRELERRETANEATIVELKKQNAGIVASHNVSNRNQSRATILGGDVGELNKLINRRGYEAIRRLVVKGEITDASTILQLDLNAAEIDRLTDILEGERADYPRGSKVIYLTGKGVPQEGTVLGETDKFVNMRKPDGTEVRVPKVNIQTSQKVAEARSVSEDPAVRAGAELPTGADFGTPRPTGSSADERPAFRRDDPERRRPRKTSAEERQRKRREADRFEGSFTEEEVSLEEALAEAERTSPSGTTLTIDEIIAQRAGLSQPTFLGRHVRFGSSSPLALVEESPDEAVVEDTPPPKFELEAQRRFEEADTETEPTPTAEQLERESKLRELEEVEERIRIDEESKLSRRARELSVSDPDFSDIERSRTLREELGLISPELEPSDVSRGGGVDAVPSPSPEQFFKGLIGTTPRQRAAEQRRKERETSQERVAQLLSQSGSVSNKTTRYLQQTKRG